ncbi:MULTISPECIES: hypothetical protein [unclassified Paenibacillus]|uniref:hypothetical protein n=1 Tax=unclassified Paenibacillus TaxID=185978 RepID=UPI001AE65C5A|nr:MULTISPECIES: hypothetical protein [unclassified Paenibacillus]MBP1156793.1 hypothetical protein [Paenibacillus sp. PvP091]MBP1172468.1 hypothetical protein [Paenibacillus sp. PvR098]MBP2438849.1 hypothetical protein [Paenibacillus sp. PvP052]
MYLGRVPGMGLEEIQNKTYEELKDHYISLKVELKVARINFEFERAMDLKEEMELIYKALSNKKEKKTS